MTGKDIDAGDLNENILRDRSTEWKKIIHV